MEQKNHLRTIRKQRLWRREDIAEAIGVEPITIGRWERGETVPNDVFRKKLSALFGISEVELGFAGMHTEQEASHSPSFLEDPDLQAFQPGATVFAENGGFFCE